MIREAKVVKGSFFYNDGKLIGEMCIIEIGGIKQFHARDYGSPPIRSYRTAVKFLKGEGLIYSGCSEKNEKVIRFLKLLGFKELIRENGNVAFTKET